MKRAYLAVVCVVFLALHGCASAPGVSSFRSVDVTRDLDASTVERYRSEAEEVARAGQSGHSLVLERTNRWPLGVVAYWRQGTVEAIRHGHGDPVYVVTQSQGYGPLSMLYVAGQTATFDADGRLLDRMGVGSVLFGHIAMRHTMEAPRSAGSHRHESLGLLHHLINLSWGHGKTRVSFFSAPNPVAFDG